MDFDDTPAEAAFRAEARAWLESHAQLKTGGRDATRRYFSSDASAEADAEHVRRNREWQRTLHDGGWAGITWPKAYGGRGGTPVEQSIFNQEQARFDVSIGVFAIAVGMVGPTLIAHGTEAQKERHLGAILRGDEVWCQLFSEPGAGSDLAGLGTRAERDGDEWVVNGQKVWTSGAHHADYAILLARSDPDQSKHRGITYFLVDMRTPGIDVRPLRQINGVAHFNEVFLTDVHIPNENVVGDPNGGWGVALTTLGNERAMIGGGGGVPFSDVTALARAFGRLDDRRVRQELAETYIRMELLRFMGLRIQTALSQGRAPGAEASVLKLAFSRHIAKFGDLVVGLQGAVGMLIDDDAPEEGYWQQQFLGSWGGRIGGGTDEVQRNVIGERSLGLPGEPREDKHVPYRELARRGSF